MRIHFFPSLSPDEPPPKLGGQRMARLSKLVAHFARLHHRRPLHGTLGHNGGRVEWVQLENDASVDGYHDTDSIRQPQKRPL